MNIDEAIKELEAQGFEVRKRRKLQIDGSFLGFEMKETRLDSNSSSSTQRLDELEQLRVDAENAKDEYLKTLDPNYQNRNESYSGKSLEALRDIAQANRDSYMSKLEGYIA